MSLAVLDNHISNPRVYPMKWCIELMRTVPGMITTAASGMQSQYPIEKMPSAADVRQMFLEYPWGDMWADANAVDVMQYVAGNRHIRVPDGWQAFLPTHIPD